LTKNALRYTIRRFKTLASTNDTVLKRARNGAAEGLVILADYQTRGRGRMLRRWISPPGENLLFTVLVRPEIAAQKAPMLTHIAAASVKTVLETRWPALNCRLKKPNDVLLNGKKVCGILVESSSSRGQLQFAAIGVGLNVNSRMSLRVPQSTSIYEENGRKTKKNTIFRSVLREFARRYQEFIESS
jgi:BirA family biotin operon repressor/biotin-[acetyl-CoA-carboxylase] ligase